MPDKNDQNGKSTPGKQGGKRVRKARKLTARVTHLEMNSRPGKTLPLPSRPRTALLRAENIPISFYRWLYEQVGKEHHWYVRRVMSDNDVAATINAETTHIEILYADGCPAGFFELDARKLPESVELVYFGIAPPYQGLGLGKWFLLQAIESAWDMDPQKITVHTNTLDHPAALGLYQRMGFSPCAISEETVTVWE